MLLKYEIHSDALKFTIEWLENNELDLFEIILKLQKYDCKREVNREVCKIESDSNDATPGLDVG